MPKVGEILKDPKKPSKSKASANGRSIKSPSGGSRRLRFEVNTQSTQPENTSDTHQAETTRLDSSQSGSSLQQTLLGALQMAQQGFTLGKALVEQRFPKAKNFIESVVDDWSSGGSFAEIPVSNPFIRKAIQNGLVQARDLQNKVMTHPQTEKLAMNLFMAGMKAQSLVEKLRTKVASPSSEKKSTDS